MQMQLRRIAFSSSIFAHFFICLYLLFLFYLPLFSCIETTIRPGIYSFSVVQHFLSYRAGRDRFAALRLKKGGKYYI